MRRRDRHEKRAFRIQGASSRAILGLADSPDYWPLTVMPMGSRPKRLTSTWMFVGAIVALGAGLLLILQPNIPTW
jgi:hypothetical protein